MKRLLLYALLASISTSAFAAHDGAWWRKLTEDQKTVYVIAFEEGHDDGVLAAFQEATALGTATPSLGKGFNSLMFGPSAYSQMRAAVDSCFSDPLNQNLGVSICLWWAEEGLRGVPEKIRRDYLQAQRRVVPAAKR